MAAWILVGIRGRSLARLGGGWVARVREVWRGVLCMTVMVWVGAVVRVVEPPVVVVGCLTERVVGARNGTMEPLSIGVTGLHGCGVGAVECVVEAMLSLR